MPKLQTFEGPELDELLARVRREVGSAAKIVSASKCRSGGMGGFFSKETFKVAVEVPDGGATAAPEEELTAGLPFEPMSVDDVQAAMATRPASLLELADLVDEAETHAVTVAPAPTPEPAPAPVEPPRAPAVATPTFVPRPYVPTTELPSFNAVLRRLASEADLDLDTPTPVAPEVVPEPVATVVDAPAPEPEPEVAAAPLPAVAARAAVAVPRNPSPSLLLPALDEASAAALAALGIPEDVLPSTLSPAAAVIAMLHSLQIPEAPALPLEDRALTVVIGERKSAVALANDLATEAGLKRTDVQVADPDSTAKTAKLRTPDEAAAARATWTGPKVLALVAPASTPAVSWAWDMLAALEPEALWGVVGADRKCEDVEAWSNALGGFDALALEELERTVSPAAMLRLGIPIARLDGRPATAATWAQLLTARIAA